MGPIRIAVVIAELGLAAAGCGGNGLTFDLAATCSAVGDTAITVTDSAGFTASGSYVSTVTGPNGKSAKGPAGKASSTGDVPNWRFACYKAKTGSYKVVITDTRTQKQATDTFVVK